jgi:hypothetical protein
VTRKEWRKPEVKQISAGAAEINSGGKDDSDPGTALNNS